MRATDGNRWHRFRGVVADEVQETKGLASFEYCRLLRELVEHLPFRQEQKQPVITVLSSPRPRPWQPSSSSGPLADQHSYP